MSVLDEETVRLMRQTQLVNYHNVAALIFLLWDTTITFGDEVGYIWPQHKGSPTKWVFLFTRYFGLMAQARLVSLNLTLSSGIFSIEVCRMIYATQVVFGGILMACAQSFLMLRVYALYTQDRRVAFSMVALLIAEIGSMPGAIKMTMPTNPGPLCMKPILARDIAFFGVSALLPQLIVVGLTVIKFFSGLRAGWGKIPIVSRLVRDDIILVTVIVVWVVVCTSLNSIDTVYGYIGYTWLISFIPSVGCRVVINMQRLTKEQNRAFGQERSSSTSSPQLTSCIFDGTPLPIFEGEASSNSISVSQPRRPRARDSRVLPSPTESEISTTEGIKAVSRDRNEERYHFSSEIVSNSDLILAASTKQARSNSYSYSSYGHTNTQSSYAHASSPALSHSKSVASLTTLQYSPSSKMSHSQPESSPPPLPPPLHHDSNHTHNSTVAVARMQIMIRSNK